MVVGTGEAIQRYSGRQHGEMGETMARGTGAGRRHTLGSSNQGERRCGIDKIELVEIARTDVEQVARGLGRRCVTEALACMCGAVGWMWAYVRGSVGWGWRGQDIIACSRCGVRALMVLASG